MIIYNCMPACDGCRHRIGWSNSADATCEQYLRPSAKWGKFGGCEGATHVLRAVEDTSKQRVGQQKQKKKVKK
jgi:hypothetical protein